MARPCAERVIAPGRLTVNLCAGGRHPALPTPHSCASLALVLACAGCFAAPAAAQADDLIQLNGDPPVTLSGGVQLRAALPGRRRAPRRRHVDHGDRRLHRARRAAADVLRLARAGNNCTNGRSLTINASGGVAISPAIDLRGLVGTNRSGGALVIRAARVSLGGAVETAGTAATSGGIVDRLARPRRHADAARARRRHHRARRGRRLDRRRRLERGQRHGHGRRSEPPRERRRRRPRLDRAATSACSGRSRAGVATWPARARSRAATAGPSPSAAATCASRAASTRSAGRGVDVSAGRPGGDRARRPRRRSSSRARSTPPATSRRAATARRRSDRHDGRGPLAVGSVSATGGASTNFGAGAAAP